MRLTPTTNVLSLLLAVACVAGASAQAPGTGTTAPADVVPGAVASQPHQAQTAADLKRMAERNRDFNQDPIRTFYLQAGSGPNYGNMILTGMRLMLDPSTKLYLIPELNAIMARCTQECLVTAQQIIRELDKPKPNYRLTYTVAESEGGKRIGVQHFALNMISGVRTTLKDGSKVPVATGSYSAGAAQSGVQTQFTYLDIGLNFDATLDQGADGMRLSSKVEQSGSAEDKTIAGITEPIIRQAVLEGSATLQVGRPLMLGTLDVAGSTRHLDIEVLLELIK